MHKSLVALSALTLGLVSTSVAARDFVVEHSDLDLSTKHDQRIMKSRVKAAAEEFCGVEKVRTGTMLQDAKKVACAKELTRLANEQIAALISQESNAGG